MSDPLIVDGDGHTMEPDDLWTERMDRSKWGDWIPRKVIEDEYYETVYAGGTIRGGGAAAGRGPRRRGGNARPQRARAAGRVHPAVGLRRRAAAQSFRLRAVLGRVPGPRHPRRAAPGCARRHTGRVPQVRARGRER